MLEERAVDSSSRTAGTEAEMSDDMQLALAQVLQTLSQWLEVHERLLPFLSPFSLHMLFQAGVALTKIRARTGSKESSLQLQLLKRGLKATNERWRAAGKSMGFSVSSIASNISQLCIWIY